MCGSSGGDGGAAEAAAAEARKQANIRAALAKINAAFAPEVRAPIYQDTYGNVLETHTADLDDQFGDAQRASRFALARRGMSGSSVDADTRSDIRERYDEAALRAAQLAEEAKQGLIASDESTRSRLVSQAYGGLGATAANQQALNQAQINASNAAADSRLSSLGQVFADIAAAHTGGQQIAGKNDARRRFAENTSAYFPGTANRRYAGTVS